MGDASAPAESTGPFDVAGGIRYGLTCSSIGISRGQAPSGGDQDERGCGQSDHTFHMSCRIFSVSSAINHHYTRWPPSAFAVSRPLP